MKGNIKLYGSVTIGERGQVVIPADGRSELKLKHGDQLLVFKAPFEDALMIVKPEVFEQHIKQMNKRADELRKQLEKEKGRRRG